MRILVCGGRKYDNYQRLAEVLGSWKPTHIICGGAPGADYMASNYAVGCKIPQSVFYADWDEHGNKAGPIRNQKMLDEGRPDMVIAFPGGRGTADMVRRARKAGVNVIEVEDTGPSGT